MEIRPGSNDPAIRPIGVILHVDAGNAASLYDYFKNRSGGIESHFHVRRDGTIEQYRGTGWEADANYKANSFTVDGERRGFISVETQGFAGGRWTRAQKAALARLLVWAHHTHGIPLRRCPGPFNAGVGYHVMFGSPGPWTPYAKSCPGPLRILQFPFVLRQARRLLGDAPPVPDPSPAPTSRRVSLDAVRKAATVDPQAPAGQVTARWAVMRVERALVAEGLLQPGYVDGHYGTKTVDAYQGWQRRCGYTGAAADGIPGKTSLTRLGRKHGFRVV